MIAIERQRVLDSNRPVAATSRSRPQSGARHSAHSNNKSFWSSQVSGNQAMQRILNAKIAQPKLKISTPGDKYEQEADRVAENVMRMPEPDGRNAENLSGDLLDEQIQRACQECEEEELQRQAIGDEDIEAAGAIDEEGEEEEIEPDETGMPKMEGAATSPTNGPARVNVPRGGGRPLESGVRLRMERSIGHDFSAVRVHTDNAAIESARFLKAYAYTVGRDIYFNQGRYSPVSFEGRKLLAHELTHVVQQTGDSAGLRISRKRPRRVNTPPPKSKGRRRSSSASSCPQGKQSKVVHNDCGNSSPVSQSEFIRHLAVSIKNQIVTASWGPPSSGTPATRTEQFDCSPNPKVTPKGTDLVGTKCSVNHTNMKKDGMAWFTGFQSTGMRIGFHNSQRVGTGIFSHGCVRVLCPIAEKINKNTWSGVTTIKVT